MEHTFSLKWWGLEHVGEGDHPGASRVVVECTNPAAYAESETIARLRYLRDRGHSLPAWAANMLESAPPTE